MKRRLWIGGAVALLAAGAGAGLALWRSRPSAPDVEASFWPMSFERPEGGELHMAGLRGQPVLLNFWATWCTPCVQEMPLLDRFYVAQRSRGWNVVGLAIDSAAPVREYLARLPISFPIAMAGPGGVGLMRGFGNHHANLPFSVVFDRSGHVTATKLGAVQPQELERWLQASG